MVVRGAEKGLHRAKANPKKLYTQRKGSRVTALLMVPTTSYKWEFAFRELNI